MTKTLKWKDDISFRDAMNTLFRGQGYLITFIFDEFEPRINDTPDHLLEDIGGCSSGQYNLAKIAIHLWESKISIDLLDFVKGADPYTLQLFLEALTILHGSKENFKILYKDPFLDRIYSSSKNFV